jgi:hypothetical protein
MNRSRLLALLFAASLVSGCTQDRVLTHSAVVEADPQQAQPQSQVAAESGDLAVQDLRVSKRFKQERVAGTLRNYGDRDYQFVEVQVNCYDADGNLIETAVGTRQSLKAGQTWRFNLRLSRPTDIDHFQVSQIIAW